MKRHYVLKNKRRFFTFLVLIISLLSTPFFANTAYGYKEPTFKTITVKSGDTLWDIAKSYYKDGDVREYIYEIKKVNKLASSNINVGDRLVLPFK